MAIQFRRGNEADLVAEQLLPAEPAFSLDTKRFLIGDGEGVAAVPTEAQVVSIATSLMSQRLPVGTILMWPGTTAPAGTLILQGQLVNRADYPDLWQFAQNSGNIVNDAQWSSRKGSFSTGNGSTTFRLPDLRGVVPVGYDTAQTEFNTLGKIGGAKTVALSLDHLPSHRSTLNEWVLIVSNSGNTGKFNLTSAPSNNGLVNVHRDDGDYPRYNGQVGGGQAHNNLQPYATVNFIIIAKADTTASSIESALAELISQTQTARDSANQAADNANQAAEAARQALDDIENMVADGVATANSYTDTVAAGKVDKVAGKGLSTNDYTNEDKAKVDNLPDDTNAALAEKADKSALTETNLRVAEISKDLSDYKTVLSQLNPNQEAKQTITDYGAVSLPVNAANGHMDVSVGGVTRTNILTENQADVEIDTSGFLVSASATLTRDTTEKVFGNASLKVVTPGSTHREGFITGSRPISPSKTYIASVYLKGSGTLACFLQFYSDDTTFLSQTQLRGITLTSNWQRISLTGVAPENAKYIRLTVRTEEDTPQAITFYADGLMIEEGDKLHNWIVGTKSTVSAMRIVSESEDETQRTELYIPDVGELRSLPNGVCDEISGGQLIQRVKTLAITANDIIGLGTSGVITEWVVIRKPTDYIGYGISSYATGTIIFGNYTEKRISTLDLPENINCISSFGPTAFYLVIPKGTYADLNAAKTALAGTKLTYQLAEPIITPINVSGTLLSYPKGTVFAEPVLPVAGIYTNDGIQVTNTDFPIESIEHIYKIDFATGVETPIDVSKVVVAGNGLGFTHPDLADGDIVFFTYYYSNTGTQPKISATYFDSRYVLKDTVTGKFYKKVETVQNGQLVTQLVEVS